jgi:protein ImuB
MVGHEGNRRVVVAADAAARAAGIGVGTPATKAQALVRGLVIQDADLDDDRKALERLAAWALRYSPIAAAAAPDGIVIDTTGADHLHGGEAPMLSDVVSRLRQAGFQVRAAISDTLGASHALARFSTDDMAIAPVGAATTLIAGLPVAALRLDPDSLDGLRKLGFRTVGELAATPRAPLTLRFGPEVCRRLDQAHGRIPEPIEPARTSDIVEVRRAFPEPISAPESLHRYTDKLVAELARILEERGLGARRLDLLFSCVDNRIEAIRIGTSTPTRDVKRLTRLLCDKIENVDPGFGIELMRLAATRAEPLRSRQFVSPRAEDSDADVSDLIDVLANRVGAAQVYRYAPIASDVPERAIARVPAASAHVGEDWPSGCGQRR